MLEYDCIESSRPKGPYMKNEKNKKRNSQKVCVRHLVVEEGCLAERERRLKDLEQLTLLSDVFMSVALSNLKACQHVVRILTGNQQKKISGKAAVRSMRKKSVSGRQDSRIRTALILFM